MAWYEVAGIVAGIISLAGFIPYVWDILAGRTVPSWSTWLIWTIVGAMLCATYWGSGARETLWVAVSYVAGPLLVFMLSLRFGTGGTSRLDMICFVLAGVSALLWAVTRKPLLSLALNIGIDLIGAVPTIRKARVAPESESLPAWSLFLAAATLNLVSVQEWAPGPLSYPLYLFAVSATMMALLLRGRAMRLYRAEQDHER